MARHGHDYRPLAKVLLAAIHLREDRLRQALGLLHELDQEFPGNALVKTGIARAEARVRNTAAAKQ